MSTELTEPSANVERIRTAYEAYARGDLVAVLSLVDPELEWTYLDPGFADPAPQVCHGREPLATALARQAARGLRVELEEVIGHGDQVMVTTRIPGVDELRLRKADDRNFDVFTFREGRIVALRACRSQSEALALVGAADDDGAAT